VWPFQGFFCFCFCFFFLLWLGLSIRLFKWLPKGEARIIMYLSLTLKVVTEKVSLLKWRAVLVIILCHLLVKWHLSQKSQWAQQPGIYLSKIFHQGNSRLWFHSRGRCKQRDCHLELGVSTWCGPKEVRLLITFPVSFLPSCGHMPCDGMEGALSLEQGLGSSPTGCILTSLCLCFLIRSLDWLTSQGHLQFWHAEIAQV
jgi:hypothetical protein